MKRNIGSSERVIRAAAGIAMILGAVVAALPRAGMVAFGSVGTYLFFTSLAGTCLGYKMIGRSTCDRA